MARGEMIFIKKIEILEEKKFSFCFISIIFFKCYDCSINLKRQSEHSGLRPDTSSLVSFPELFNGGAIFYWSGFFPLPPPHISNFPFFQLSYVLL